MYLRPHAREFCAWALDNFEVGVWSSAQAHNVHQLVSLCFQRRVGEYQRAGVTSGKSGHVFEVDEDF